MLTSMTGFGRAEVELPPAGRAVVEIQTLNHRFLDMECRLPDGFQSFEEQVRSLVAGKIHRGRVRVFLNWKAQARRIPVDFREGLARQYVAELKRLQRNLQLSGPVTLEMILGLPQVVTVMEQEALPPQGWASVKGAMGRALAQVMMMRRKEGDRLAKAVTRHVRSLATLSRRIQNRLPGIQREAQKRLIQRVQAIVPTADPKAVVGQVISFAQATDVTEELVRISSHLLALRKAVQGSAESPGRTIDFLAQELHREVNTLGTKVRQGQVVRWVVEMKNQIEKLREQAANIE